jgi:hypothetical protein
MRFEVFEGPRSIATVSLRADGRVLLRARDEDARDRILPHFQADPGAPEGLEVVTDDTFDPLRFEILCGELADEAGLSVAPRPVGAEE